MKTQLQLPHMDIFEGIERAVGHSNNNSETSSITSECSDTTSKVKITKQGPLWNPFYKKNICKQWSETNHCPYGVKCQFAHGTTERQYWEDFRQVNVTETPINHLSSTRLFDMFNNKVLYHYKQNNETPPESEEEFEEDETLKLIYEVLDKALN